MRQPSARQLGTLAVALMIVLAGVPGGAVAQQSNECTASDVVYGITFGFVGQALLGGDASDCTTGLFSTNDAVEEVRDAETAQDKVDLYTAATAQASQQEVYTSTVDNYIQDTDSIAWSKAEVAIAEAHEAGETKAEAKTAAREAIAGYYSVKQKNLLTNWNTSWQSLRYLTDRASQEGFDQTQIIKTRTEEGVYTGTGQTLDTVESSNVTVTLVNSSTATAYEPVVKVEHGSGGFYEYRAPIDAGPSGGTAPFSDGTSPDKLEIVAVAPNSNYENSLYINITQYQKRWNQIETKNSELQGEAEKFVDAIWSDLESGALNSSDVISRNTQLFEYGTAAQQSDAGFYDTVGATAALGLQTPDLAETSSMTVEYKGNTYNGLLFARSVPGGSWSVGQTYNTTNFGGPVILATVENGELVLDGEFTLTEARNKAGDPVGTVQTTRYNYQTADTSELNQQLDQLAELTGELQNRSDAAGGGGGGIGGDVGGFLEDIGTALGFGAGVGLIVVLVVAAVAARVFTG
jgi:hypothetical protein